ncbi:unnamed protein product [marine sediment metagenome]|uniref:Uncharacterized protein n=1 Tax=marine sediment metagenome TaxID=412755 RepID=X1VME9_9ZZZZ
MDLSGIAKGAALILGIGILSEKMGAGTGLATLGGGIASIAAAPMVGAGTGMSTLATGISDIGGAFGDIGRGIGDILKFLPKLPGYVGPGGAGSGLLPQGGGDDPSLLPGGGGNVPIPFLAIRTTFAQKKRMI